MERVEAVRQLRLASKSEPTRKIAATPTRFHVENMPKGNFLVVPEVSSERREYIPIGFMTPEVICSNLVKLVPYATLFHYGVLQSTMHMSWMRQVCGRLKSDYRYSSSLVYNNFPWPKPLTKAALVQYDNQQPILVWSPSSPPPRPYSTPARNSPTPPSLTSTIPCRCHQC